MGGYIGPASDVGIDYSNILDILTMVSIAWVFYGIMGGFIVLAIGGAAASKLTLHKTIKTEHSQVKNLVVRAVCVSFLGCGALAILDFIIGPWWVRYNKPNHAGSPASATAPSRAANKQRVCE